MNRICTVVFGALMLTLLFPLGASAQGRKADPDLVRARQLFFGAENVDPHSGNVKHDKVIFSWFTNSSYAVSLKGRIILLDSYVHRAETEPGRTPLVVEDLVSLRPEAIFLGHGHGDHADNAAFVAGTLGIPIYSSQETCVAMQQDATNLFTSGVIHSPTVDCREVTTTGSTPGAEIVNIDQLEPLACITAFRHLHSTTVPQDTDFPIVPVINDRDPRDAEIYPAGTPHSFPTSGVGGGGPISIFYQFRLRRDNQFTFVWHNTTGAIKEGCGADQCWGPVVGQHLTEIMQSLPSTDVELGSMVSVGFGTNGMRDPILYQLAIQPKVYIPIHQTNAAMPTSSLRFKTSYFKQLDAMNVPQDQRPEARWVVDPNEYLKPQVYDPKDDRWKKPDLDRRNTLGVCHPHDGDHDKR
jgi:hypothetical protein